MAGSSSHRKFMLLKHRLLTLNGVKDGIPGGTVTTIPEKRPWWGFKFENGYEIPIVEKSTLDNYVLGRNPQRTSKDKKDPLPINVLNESLCHVFPELAKATSEPISDSENLSVSKFGQIIGLTKDESRYVIDKEYAANFPMLRSLSIGPKPAKMFCKEYGGCCSLYRHDQNSVTAERGYPNGVLIRAAVSVRYPVPHKSFGSQSKGACNIRAKLNLPSYSHKKLKTYEYDGLVGHAGSTWWAWMFQGRFGDSNTAIEDLMMMYTGDLQKKTDGITQGEMLTQNQDSSNTPTSSNVVLIREPGYEFIEKENNERKHYCTMSADEDEFMHETPKIINLNAPETWEFNEKKAVSLLLSTQKIKG